MNWLSEVLTAALIALAVVLCFSLIQTGCKQDHEYAMARLKCEQVKANKGGKE